MGATRHEIGSTLVWRPDRAGTPDAFSAVEWCDPGQGAVAAAESFRLAAGRVRGIARHRARFRAGAARRAPGAEDAVRASAQASPASDDTAAQLELFWRDAVALFADVAAHHPETPLFPRLERRERGEWRLLLRPSPPTSRTAVLATAASDPRRHPLTKGPDLDRLAALRTAAQAAGADEAVIVDARGRVIEGAYSAVIWSRGDELGVIADGAPRIPSVTERVIRDAASATARRVVEGRPTPEDLGGAAVWVLSALHGARAVTAWVDGPSLGRNPALDQWLDASLAAAERPIPIT